MAKDYQNEMLSRISDQQKEAYEVKNNDLKNALFDIDRLNTEIGKLRDKAERRAEITDLTKYDFYMVTFIMKKYVDGGTNFMQTMKDTLTSYWFSGEISGVETTNGWGHTTNRTVVAYLRVPKGTKVYQLANLEGVYLNRFDVYTDQELASLRKL